MLPWVTIGTVFYSTSIKTMGVS